FDEGAHQAKDSIVLDRADAAQGVFECLAGLLHQLLAAIPVLRVMKRAEDVDQRLGRVRSAAKRVDDRGDAVGYAGLAQIAEPGAKPDDGLRGKVRGKNQL